jgi:hypothetical protein
MLCIFLDAITINIEFIKITEKIYHPKFIMLESRIFQCFRISKSENERVQKKNRSRMVIVEARVLDQDSINNL